MHVELLTRFGLSYEAASALAEHLAEEGWVTHCYSDQPQIWEVKIRAEIHTLDELAKELMNYQG